MKKRTTRIMAILMAASLMTSLCSLPALAAEIEEERQELELLAGQAEEAVEVEDAAEETTELEATAEETAEAEMTEDEAVEATQEELSKPSMAEVVEPIEYEAFEAEAETVEEAPQAQAPEEDPADIAPLAEETMPESTVAVVTNGEALVEYYDTLADALTAARSGYTVTLQKDTTLGTQVTIGDITLDLNGCAVTVSGSNSGLNIHVNGSNPMTIKNGTWNGGVIEAGIATVVLEAVTSIGCRYVFNKTMVTVRNCMLENTKATITAKNGAELVLEGDTRVSATGTTSSSYAIAVEYSALVVGEGVVVSSQTSSTVKVNDNGLMTSAVTVNGTVINGGSSTCTDADHVIGKANMKLVEAEVPATFDSDGKAAVYLCTKCFAVRVGGEIIPATGTHEYEDFEQPATCTEDGYKARICKSCSPSHVEEGSYQVLPALGHTKQEGENSYISKVEPTCTQDGVLTYLCTACGQEFTEIIPATGHTEVIDEAVAPTCTETGLTEGKHCAVCHEVIEAQTVVEALGHDFDTQWLKDDEGHWHQCSRCEETDPKEEHTWDAGTTTQAPTASETGVKTYTCTVCGQTKTETIPATGETGTGSGGGTDSGNAGSGGTDSGSTGSGSSGGTGSGSAGSGTGGTGNTGSGSAGSGTGGTGSTGNTDSSTDTGSEEAPSTSTETNASAGEDEEISDEGPILAGKAFLFRDVPTKAWYYEAVNFVYQRDIMTGTTKDGTAFSPEVTTTRGMIVSILYRLDQERELADARIPMGDQVKSFSDVTASAWYGESVAWAASAGIVAGYKDGTFGPMDDLTREQLVCILYRYALSLGCDMTVSKELDDFEDGDSVAKYAKESMKWAVGAGIISGKKAGGKVSLDPQGTATRAEMAKVMMNFCNLIDAINTAD